jgi:hypothetical protein
VLAIMADNELPPSVTRPPTGRMTRSQSANATLQTGTLSIEPQGIANTEPGTATMALPVPPAPNSGKESASKPITFESSDALEAFLDQWSKSRSFSWTGSNQLKSSASADDELPSRKEADRVLWRKLPSVPQYDDWRHSIIANVVAASVSQPSAMMYMAAVDTDADVSTDKTESRFHSLDAKMKAALLSAVQEAPEEHRNRIMAAYGRNPIMSGREFLRIIDQDYGLRTTETLAQKNVSLLGLECRSYKDFDNFFTKWKRLEGEIRGSKQDLPLDTKLAFLRRALSSVSEVSAILAQNQASSGTYDELINALTSHEAIHRAWILGNGKKKVPIAGSAIASSHKAPFKPCAYCTEKFKGKNKKISHTDEQCFSNPNSKNYRPLPNGGKKRQHTPAAHVNSVSSAMPNDDNSIEKLADTIIMRLKESGQTTAKAGMAKSLHVRPTIDSGASYSISGQPSALGEELHRERMDEPMNLACVGGTTEVLDLVTVENPMLGEITALHVENSPPLLSLGQLVQKGYSFMWDPETFQQPLLIRPDGYRVPLDVENLTPVLGRKACFAAPIGVKVHSHSTLHFPMLSDCPVCMVTKVKRTPARKSKDTNRKDSVYFNQKATIDLIEVSEPDLEGNTFLFTYRDDFSGWVAAIPQKSKTASDSLDSFREIVRELPSVPETVRSDNGREFSAEFEDELKKLYIKHEYSVPYRSTTNAKHERLNQEINRGIRALLFQAGLPVGFWGHAARYVSEVFNHLQIDGTTFPRNPCELRNGRECDCHARATQLYKVWPNFGAHAIFIPPQHDHKFDSRTKSGILLGIRNQTDAIVLDTERYLKYGEVSVSITRDVKIENSVYPARELGLRPEPDLIFYQILKRSPDDQAEQFCLRCKQLRPSDPLSCIKCLNINSSDRHTRDRNCKFGRCRCRDLENYVPEGYSSAQNFWDFDDETGNEHEFFEHSNEQDGVVNDEYHQRPPTTGLLEADVPKEISPPLEVANENFYEMEDVIIHNASSIDDLQNSAGSNHDPFWETEYSDGENSAASNKACLTRVVDTTHFESTPEGRAAIHEELRNMLHHEVWKFDEMVPRAEAQKIPGAVFVPVKLIMGMKNAEKEVSQRKLKARLVAQGCSMVDGNRKRTSDDMYPYEAPASLLSFRLAMWAASHKGMQAGFADMKSAYLHAPLKGPPTFLILPKGLHPKEWEGFMDPVVPARKAIYGLSRSGSDFGSFLRKQLLNVGWTQSSFDKNSYFKDGSMLVIYVDDLCIVSSDARIGAEVQLLQKSFDIPEVIYLKNEGDSATYLGIDVSLTNKNIILSSEKYLGSVLAEYCDEVKKPELRKCKTPSWGHENVSNDEDLEAEGEMKDRAPAYVGKLLWLSRTTRPDIAFAAGFIGRMVHRWTRFADRCLARVMQYLFSHRDFVLRYNCKSTTQLMDAIHLKIFCDADHANSGAKSTSGLACLLKSEDKAELVHWSSKLQTSTATSSTEAELIATVYGLKEGAVLETFIDELSLKQENRSSDRVLH